MPTILPPATLGMLGGGQLGRFFVRAAHELGYGVWVLDPDPASPAGQIADRHLCAGFDDRTALDALAQSVAAVTTEFENVPAATLEHLATKVVVQPNARAVATCQDRLAEKDFLTSHGLPVGPYAAIRDVGDVRVVDAGLFPAILKTARLGYDGKGQAKVTNAAEAAAAFARFGGSTCILEKELKLDCEISVVLGRDSDGQVRCYPVAENGHTGGILDVSIAPARIGAGLAAAARKHATTIADRFDYVGTLGVELFISDGQLLINEMAPRPHNSGHYTLDACRTNQFEQQVRALCGLPLGNTDAHSAACMVNLLGDLWFEDGRQREPDWARLLAVPGLGLHLYGKREPRPGRKMGHFTVIGDDLQAVVDRCLVARRAIGILAAAPTRAA